MRILVCGDLMPGGVLPYQSNYLDLGLREYMDGFDFRIGTLEAAIGTGFPFDPIKMGGRQNIIYARDEDFFRVKEMRFDVVSLANNHVWDLGVEGLRNTIRLLNDNGIKYCGAGENADEAAKPAVIEKDGCRVAVLAYCMYGNPWIGYVELAGENKAGVNPLDIDTVVEDIKSAKKEYDKVIVLPHWGREYQYKPLPDCIQMAKQMISAGADAVLASHPHQIQPLVYFKGKPVCFSMGNFLFPDFYMYPPRPIWYPDSIEEVNGIKDVTSYPFPIKEPIRQVWNPVSRYGYLIELTFDSRGVKVDCRSVCSSADNVEMLAEIPKSIRNQIRKVKIQIKNPALSVLIRILRKMHHTISNNV